MLNILDTINAENNKIIASKKLKEKQQKKSEKFYKKEIARITNNAKRQSAINSLKSKIAEFKDSLTSASREHEKEKKFQADCKKTFDDFLDLTQNSSELRGIQTFSTENGQSIIIFTNNLGPFSKIQLPEDSDKNEISCFLYEGFAKNEQGLYEYYNLAVKKTIDAYNKTTTRLKGFSVDPCTYEAVPIDESTNEPVTFIEAHFNALEKEYGEQESSRNK